jgi:hypothetical protein
MTPPQLSKYSDFIMMPLYRNVHTHTHTQVQSPETQMLIMEVSHELQLSSPVR